MLQNTYTPKVNPPTDTPWGPAQNAQAIGAGVWIIDTAGHGGLYIEGPAYESLPKGVAATFMNGGHWAEEDCEMAIALSVLRPQLDDDELHFAMPTALQPEENGELKIDRIAREMCQSYDQYRPCLPYLSPPGRH